MTSITWRVILSTILVTRLGVAANAFGDEVDRLNASGTKSGAFTAGIMGLNTKPST